MICVPSANSLVRPVLISSVKVARMESTTSIICSFISFIDVVDRTSM